MFSARYIFPHGFSTSKSRKTIKGLPKPSGASEVFHSLLRPLRAKTMWFNQSQMIWVAFQKVLVGSHDTNSSAFNYRSAELS